MTNANTAAIDLEAGQTGGYDAIMAVTDRPPITFAKGEGGWLWDDAGKRYLDFIQGWAVNCLGHCPPAIARAQTDAGSIVQPETAFPRLLRWNLQPLLPP